MLVVCCLMFIGRCLLFVVDWLVLVSLLSLFVVCCLLFVVDGLVFGVRCSLCLVR